MFVSSQNQIEINIKFIGVGNQLFILHWILSNIFSVTCNAFQPNWCSGMTLCSGNHSLNNFPTFSVHFLRICFTKLFFYFPVHSAHSWEYSVLINAYSGKNFMECKQQANDLLAKNIDERSSLATVFKRFKSFIKKKML